MPTHQLHSSKGFTLIELLVVISIMVTMLSIGVAYYSGFAQTANLDGTNKQFKANLRLAASFALSGEKIGSSCVGTFNGYYVTLVNGSSSYQLGQYCSSSGTTDRTPPSPISLPTGITISNITYNSTPVSQMTILFQSVRGISFYTCSSPPCFDSATKVTGPVVFNVQQGTTTRTITVTNEGLIQ